MKSWTPEARNKLFNIYLSMPRGWSWQTCILVACDDICIRLCCIPNNHYPLVVISPSNSHWCNMCLCVGFIRIQTYFSLEMTCNKWWSNEFLVGDRRLRGFLALENSSKGIRNIILNINLHHQYNLQTNSSETDMYPTRSYASTVIQNTYFNTTFWRNQGSKKLLRNPLTKELCWYDRPIKPMQFDNQKVFLMSQIPSQFPTENEAGGAGEVCPDVLQPDVDVDNIQVRIIWPRIL